MAFYIWGMGPRLGGLLPGSSIRQAETEHLQSHDAAIGDDMKLAPDLQVLCASCFANRCTHSSVCCQVMKY